MRKAEATLGDRRVDPASPSPKYFQLREILLDLVAAELDFDATIPPSATSPNTSGCPG